MSEFKRLLQASMKSSDTEETIDVYFTRPIGLVFALFWNKLGVHPNAITVLSIFLGLGAAYMFYFEDLWHNVMGIVLLMLANFCDSTDGQMARLTGKKTLLGRVLDGFSGNVWFSAIYIALALRMQDDNMPFTSTPWGVWIWIPVAVAGLLSHSPQSSLADYYRQIHLFFLKGKAGSELDTYEQQIKNYEREKVEGTWWSRLFYRNYANYCKSQESRTPQFQRFFQLVKERFNGAETMPEDLKERFLAGSRPLMKYTNILTFNIRAVFIYTTCLLDCPWVYLLAEITVFNIMYVYMHNTHEKLSRQCADELAS